MEQAVAYSTLAMTVSLAVLRPRVGPGWLRFSPGSAAVLGVLVLLATGLLDVAHLEAAARLQWRPLFTLTCIMVMTGVVREVGAFDRLASWMEARAAGRSAASTFTLVFVLSVVTPALLNNDAAILILTPIVVTLTRRLHPGREDLVIAFAFAVFLAPGVAPFLVSNPMNMIVAEFAGLGFNSYAAVMAPISLVGALLTYAVLRVVYRDLLREHPAPAVRIARPPARRSGERAAVVLMLLTFTAYPIAAWFGAPVWIVAAGGALGALTLSRTYNIAPTRRIAGHISVDILAFLWGIFLVVQGLRAVGVVDWLSGVYGPAPASGAELARIGVVSAVGSALIDNHPMSILNMIALEPAGGTRPLLAALIGGDIGPRLLPIGSLAGLLWIDLLRRMGVDIGIRRFVRLGTLVLLPTLAVSLAMLALL